MNREGLQKYERHFFSNSIEYTNWHYKMMAILKDVARRWLSCKILQDKWLFYKVLAISFRSSSILSLVDTGALDFNLHRKCPGYICRILRTFEHIIILSNCVLFKNNSSCASWAKIYLFSWTLKAQIKLLKKFELLLRISGISKISVFNLIFKRYAAIFFFKKVMLFIIIICYYNLLACFFHFVISIIIEYFLSFCAEI